jgi:hypothetical protein
LNQVSNWRYWGFLAALSCAALGGLLYDRLSDPETRKAMLKALVLLAIFVLGSLALVMARAGMPLSRGPILVPTLVVISLLAVLAVILSSRKYSLIIVFAFAELLVYDRAYDHSLFPHPHNALKNPAITSCVPNDPAYRFAGYGDIIHPNLGMLLDRRYDLRSYEMIMPEDLVEWMAAVNNWDHLRTAEYYLTHYYFAPEPDALLSPEVSKASLSRMLSEDFLPPPKMVEQWFENGAKIAPGPEYLQKVKNDINGVTRSGWFMHAPSVISVHVSTDNAQKKLAAFAAMSPLSWERPGDGVFMQVATEGSAPGLVYARYLNPIRWPGERTWLLFKFIPGGSNLKVSSLPGPRDDQSSDYALFADVHVDKSRKAFEKRWKLEDSGDAKCYRNLKARPRLRIAEAVTITGSREECFALARSGGLDSEIVEDRESSSWPVGPGRVIEVAWGDNRVAAEVEMESPGALILADAMYPGWEALVDGFPVRIHRTNCIFRGIKLDAGRHQVVFRFVPESFRIGLWISLVSWLIFMGAIFFRGARRG